MVKKRVSSKARMQRVETEDGDIICILKKGRKWFSIDCESSPNEIRRMKQQFGKEWNLRVGQYIGD